MLVKMVDLVVEVSVMVVEMGGSGTTGQGNPGGDRSGQGGGHRGGWWKW